MGKLILLALTVTSVFLTYEMAQWLGLINTFSPREMWKFIGVDRGTSPAADDPNPVRQMVINRSKTFLLMLFMFSCATSGALIVATFTAFF